MAKSFTFSGGPSSIKGKDVSAGTCLETECNKKGERLNFCADHFRWFKAGLINKKGIRPVDFEKKMAAFFKQKN